MNNKMKELIVRLIGGVLLGLIILYMIGGQITPGVIALVSIGSILMEMALEILQSLSRNIRPIQIA